MPRIPSPALLRALSTESSPSSSYVLLNALVGTEAPFQVRESPGAGRGLFASDDLPAGLDIYRANPVVCHPSPQQMGKVCSFCLTALPPLPSGAGPYTAANDYCSDTCGDLAKNSFAQVERAAQEYGNLLQYCGETAQKYPLMVHRLACGTLQEHIQLTKGDQFPQQWLRMLVKPNLPAELPAPWIEGHSLVLKSLQSAFSPGERTVRKQIEDTFTLDWYAHMLGRLNLNSFRVQTVAPFLEEPTTSSSGSVTPPPPTPTPVAFWPPRTESSAAAPSSSSSSPFGAHLMDQLSSLVGDGDDQPYASASALPDAGSPGSALYFVPSFINHSCEPLVDVLHPENSAVAVFRTRRAIAKGEELTITYIDATAGVRQRQSELGFKYGFQCKCPRCAEGE